MKKRIAIISLVLVALVLGTLPGTVTAARPASDPFHATGYITGIEDTIEGDNAFPLGNSGKWRVKDRDITGNLSGDISDNFILTYDGVFSIATQAGCLVGDMVTENSTFFVMGSIKPYELVDTEYGKLPKLTISGIWVEKFSRHHVRMTGSNAGKFEAWLIFVPDDEGHVTYVIASSFEMTGNGYRMSR